MSVTTQYDQMIKDAVTQWLPQWDWLYLKAQFYQESLLQPDAVSPAGAKGLCQFMPETWTDVKMRLRTIIPANATPFQPEYAIQGGVYYMALMRNGWSAPRPEEDRRRLALASYNAGFGSILEAQKLSGGAHDYETIIAQLENVTGSDNANQTKTYVTKIQQYYDSFKAEEAASEST